MPPYAKPTATYPLARRSADIAPPGHPIIRLLDVLLHGGNTVGGWTAKQIHEAVLTTFQLSPKTYGLNQLRYDLRKLKGHGLLQRDGRRYSYLLCTTRKTHIKSNRRCRCLTVRLQYQPYLL